MEKEKVYMVIDLKSFYASVECIERQLDPLTTNLVVADASRTEKTICLAVSPSLKKFGISGRARLFEVVQKIQEVNGRRRMELVDRTFTGVATDEKDLLLHPEYAVDYIVAPPQMAKYMAYSTRIYQVYLKYIAPEDMHVYSIDEVFIDATAYLELYHLTAYELCKKIIQDVLATTGITATAGIGNNMYLAKIALDIMSKRISPDQDGVRIAQLDTRSYREQLWNHEPLTDFWRIGSGYVKKLKQYGLVNMGDIARCSIGKPGDFYNAELLYRLFGVNAELLIDHAWGWEPCTLPLVKAYKPENTSISSGQVLHCPYTFEKGLIIVKEMTELLALDLVEKGLVTDQLVMTIGYDIDNLKKGKQPISYQGEVTVDRYGRKVPKHAHGTKNLKNYTSSTKELLDGIEKLYQQIVNPNLFIRRVNIVANHIRNEKAIQTEGQYEQMTLFMDVQEMEKQEEAKKKERQLQEAMLSIKKKFGKNAILTGTNFKEGATTRDRNNQIGGHKA
ncbi:MAG: DNA methylase [Lachnospiraceae bacterium]|nr:DNA methylase [Lachnospiraceae bacterium]